MAHNTTPTNQSQAPVPGTSDQPPRGLSLSPPSLSLPKGGGAIRGIGEKFAANPVTGTGSMSVPIFTSAGRSGFGPQLSLSYDSGASNGPFGLGWSLALPAISRKMDKGLPQYRDDEDSDVFLLSGVEDLVPVVVQDGTPDLDTTRPGYTILRYRPRIEGLFALIERWTHTSGQTHWRSISRDNVTTIYGKDDNSRIFDPSDQHPGHRPRTFSWLICASYDDKGNAVTYEYEPENEASLALDQANELNRSPQSHSTNRYIKRIRYGNRAPNRDLKTWQATDPTLLTDWMFEVVFDYGDHDPEQPTPMQQGLWPCRTDPFSSYRAGFEVRTYRLCRRVLMFHRFSELGSDACLVRSTDFTYHESSVASYLAQVTQIGYVRDARDGTYQRQTFPPLKFTYSETPTAEQLASQPIRYVEPTSLDNLPIGLDGGNYQWVDLDGEGLAGLLSEQGGAWLYKRNISQFAPDEQIKARPDIARFAPTEVVTLQPNRSLTGGQAQLLDLAGDGQIDLVAMDGPVRGFYERTDDGHWAAFRPFRCWPNVDTRDPNLRFVDLTGDGHADLLITEDDTLTWYPSLAEDGLGPAKQRYQALDEEQGPRLVFADGTQSIYLADMSGDGLADLVRIRNGAVCYWPNLGYGRFGRKVAMDHAPWFDAPDQFDQRRIRLADTDGSGTTDILYLGREAAQVYFNQAGNRWSDTVPLPQFPLVDTLAAVQVVDLLGNGTACLVWSSPLPGNAGRQMRYIDLMGGQKPHLLIGTQNSLGAETLVTYAPSTAFYLRDKYAGSPWVTRLPFPVHVVERVDTIDHISRSRFVTRYAYHHGFFDGEEREFRGFAMVEQWDTETFAALRASDTLPEATNVDASSYVPPVHTKTWFHTGVFAGRERISRHLAHEYYGAPPLDAPQFETFLSTLLDDTVLPKDLLTVDELRQACRALKGSILRQEIYADDDGPRAGVPYSVSEHNYAIELVQRQHANRHAVFVTHPRETVSTHYERNPDDPRVQHELVLSVDRYGNVLRSASIGYGRRGSDLPAQWEPERQTTALLTCTENDVTNTIDQRGRYPDDYRAPLPSESRTYELTGPTLVGHEHLSFKTVQDATAGAATIPYEQAPDLAKLQKRLIERVRTLYRADTLDRLLAKGELEPLALPGESYKLAFTPGLLSIYKRTQTRGAPVELLPVPSDVLGGRGADRGGYVDLEHDASWWIPSGRVFYHPEGTVADELAEARRHFFLPRRFEDPFGQRTTIGYDEHALLVRETRDAVENVTTATTINDKGRPVTTLDYRVLQPWLVTDANGNRTAVAFDALGLVVATAFMGKVGETDPAQMGDTLADPTTKLEYSLFEWAHHGRPTFVRTLAREQHGAANPRWQETYSYADGFGREIQKKIQAEPGPLVPGGETVPARWVGSGWTIFNNKGKPVRQYEPFFSATPAFEFARVIGVSPVLFYDPLGRVVATLHPDHTWEKVVFDPWKQTSWDVNDTLHPLLRFDPRQDTILPDHTFDPATDPDVGVYFARLPRGEYWPTWYRRRMDPAEALAHWPDEKRGTPLPDNAALRARERQAAERAARHASTPTVVHFDTLGRPFLTVDDNGDDANGGPQLYATRVVLDIEGNQREVIDANGRVVMAYAYDMLGGRIYQASMDAGKRWMLNDVLGKPLRAWDSRGHSFTTTYDALRRRLEAWVQGADPSNLVRKILYQKLEYGESHPEALRRNLRTRLFQQYDGAGVVTNEAYDFKGNLLRGSRRLAREYKQAPDWSQQPELESEVFTSSTRYDALNRPVQLVAPHAGTTVDVIQPRYNEANLLEALDVWLKQTGEPASLLAPQTATLHPVTNLDYNARGQRELIAYGNGARTTYGYDAQTLRLSHLVTVRGNQRVMDCQPQPRPRTCEDPPAICRQLRGNRCVLQDLAYTYDPSGNITHIQDEAQQLIYFKGQVVKAHADYTYDALYRLITATGREHAGGTATDPPGNHPEWKPDYDFNDATRSGLPHPNDGQKMRGYGEQYAYDAVGNILRMVHEAEGGGWARRYEYATDSNRLLGTSLPGDREGEFKARYAYDAHGNMTSMPHLPLMQWDFKDQLQASSQQVRTLTGTPETTYYVYDAAGQRVRKVTERQASLRAAPTRKSERIYLGGFEIYREYGSSSGTAPTLERETLHLMDDKQRIALVETRTKGAEPKTPERLTRYQLGNHLGSASLELDERALIVSYEEYHPYGSTAYQAVRTDVEAPRKRYRYTGKERDEESGLYYHGARYYACWIGRWTSADPAGFINGLDLYVYVQGNPVKWQDPTGYAAWQGGSVDLDENSPPSRTPKEPEEPEVIPSDEPIYIPGEKENRERAAKWAAEQKEKRDSREKDERLMESKRRCQAAGGCLPDPVKVVEADENQGSETDEQQLLRNEIYGESRKRTGEFAEVGLEMGETAFELTPLGTAKSLHDVPVNVRQGNYSGLAKTASVVLLPAAGIVLAKIAKVSKVAKVFVWTGTKDTGKNAEILREEMVKVGVIFQKGDYAHHIVPSTHPDAASIRQILRKFQVDINSPENGVKLTMAEHYSQLLHSTRGIAQVKNLLDWCNSKDEVLEVLRFIRSEILKGRFAW